MDNILKKPLYHFALGTNCLSISTMGCNLRCLFCQNYSISQPEEILGENLSPENIIEITKNNNLPGIAYTYTEPTVFYEYAYDCMKLAHKQGLYNVWVSNGYTNQEPVKKISRYLDAINVDLKGDLKFYQKLCAVPNEEPMHESLKIYKKNGVWIEVTNLIIPGYNDKKEQISKVVNWVKQNLGADTPLHFSRFYPHYKLLNVPPTPTKTLEMAVNLGLKAGLHWIYLGNVYAHPNESTICWKCGKTLIKRVGMDIIYYKFKCPQCGINVPIAGKKWSVLK
jgi:pyruvate formate lyase activating enzyme